MLTIKEEFVFEDLNSAINKFANVLNDDGKLIKSATKNDYKEKIIEKTHVFWCIKNATKVLSSYKNMQQTPFWTISELLTELLCIDPPIMDRYNPEIMEWSYKLAYNRKARYLYGKRWDEFNQLFNTYHKFKSNPTTKKAVMTIFEGYDTNPEYADVPCTTQYHFILRDGKMHLTTFFRSHDFFSGLKYDVVLSSFILQSFCSWLKADGIAAEPGQLYFYENSLHWYPNKDSEKMNSLIDEIKNTPSSNCELKLDKSDITTYWKDLRNIKHIEEISYWGNFDLAIKQLDKINSAVFRDFARFYIMRNTKRMKNEILYNSILQSIETSRLKNWIYK